MKGEGAERERRTGRGGEMVNGKEEGRKVDGVGKGERGRAKGMEQDRIWGYGTGRGATMAAEVWSDEGG